MVEQHRGVRKRSVAYGTWKLEEITIRTRVWNSDLGRMPIAEVTADHCQDWLDQQRKLVPKLGEDGRPLLVVERNGELVPVGRDAEGKALERGALNIWIPGEEPLKPASQGRLLATMSRYFEIARSRRHKLVSANPWKDVELDRQSKQVKKRKSLTPRQAAGLNANLLKFITDLRKQGRRFEAMVLVARDTGMRRGEICALRRSALHKSNRGPFIQVDRGIHRIEGGLAVGATKTGQIREIPIGEDTYELLRSLPENGEFFFTTSSGSPVRPDNFSRDFRKFRDSIGMPDLKLHNLRHTYISLLLRAGMNLKAVQKLVGHLSHRMIMEIYAEVYDDSLLGAPAALKESLRIALEEEELEAAR